VSALLVLANVPDTLSLSRYPARAAVILVSKSSTYSLIALRVSLLQPAPLIAVSVASLAGVAGRLSVLALMFKMLALSGAVYPDAANRLDTFASNLVRLSK